MNTAFRNVWRPDGTINGRRYFIIGVVLFALKYNLDRLAAAVIFNKRWILFDYFQHDPDWGKAEIRGFYACMIGLALPFIWAGVVLTLGRLRSAGLPLGLVTLFFVPFVNLVLFAVLSVLPSKHDAIEEKTISSSRFGQFIPDTKWGSAAVAIGVATIMAIFGTAFSTSFLRTYGAGLFVSLPFSLGLLSVLVYGYHKPRTLRESLTVSIIAVILAGVALLVVAIEGVICLIMAAPIGVALSCLGGWIGHSILLGTWWRRDADKIFCTVLLAAPCLIGFEHFAGGPAPLLKVQSSVDINAAPEKVWKHVVEFSQLPPANEWIFKLGIAYPINARIQGKGVGAVRHCNFTTGPFVEPIEVWDEPRLLKFSVTSNPAPMQEWTPYRHIHPPHLDGFLASRGKQFLLTRNADGSTHLEGTTWYYHNMWPASYWQKWSDFIIHTIHLRVLNHVKQVSEQETI